MPAVRAVGVEHHRRVVVQARRAALEERADHDHAVLAGRRGQRLAGRAGNRLGLVEAGVVFALAGILPGEQLLQADDVGAGGGRFADPRKRLVDVLLLRRLAGHLHQRHDDRARLRLADAARLGLVCAGHRRHGTLSTYDAQTGPRTIYYWHRHRNRQDLRRRADRRALVAAGHRVGVYKPAASGCRAQDGDTGVRRRAGACGKPPARRARWPKSARRFSPRHWRRTWRPRAEGQQLDADTACAAASTSGSSGATSCSSKGAGGLMSPLGDDEYVADLAYDFGFPLVVVARNALGTINHVLQTLITAATFRDGLPVAGIVLNRTHSGGDPQLRAENAREIRRRAVPPLLAEVAYQARQVRARGRLVSPGR